MPPSRRLNELQALVGSGEASELLLHFLRDSSSDVARAADAFFAWREAHPHDSWPDQQQDQEDAKPAKPSPKRGKHGVASSPSAASPKRVRASPSKGARSSAAAGAAAATHVAPVAPLPSSPAPTASPNRNRGRTTRAAPSSPAIAASPATQPTMEEKKTSLSAASEAQSSAEVDVEMAVEPTPPPPRSDEVVPRARASMIEAVEEEAVSGRKRKQQASMQPRNGPSSAGLDDGVAAKKIKLFEAVEPSSIGILSASLSPTVHAAALPSPSVASAGSHDLPLAAAPFTSPIPTAAFNSPVLSSAAPRSPAFSSAALAPDSPSPLRSPAVGQPPATSSPGSASRRPSASKHTPLPLPMPFEQTPPKGMEGVEDGEFASGANLADAFASAATAMDTSFAPASSTASARAALASSTTNVDKRPSTCNLLSSGKASPSGFGEAKPFKPPTRTTRPQSASTLPSSQASSSSPSPSPASSSSSLPPSQEFVEQRVRNRGKFSSLDALISGLEEDISKQGTEVEPDVMKEAVDEAVGVAIKQAATQPTPIAAAVSPAASSRPPRPLPRPRFLSNAHLQQQVLSLLQEQCCVPTTAGSIFSVLNSEWEVDEAAVQAQLDKLVQAGKLATKQLSLHASERADQLGEREDLRMVDVIWLQPMELAAIVAEPPSLPAASEPPPPPVKPSSGPPATPAKPSQSSDSTLAATGTPARPASSSPSTPMSASNHLAKTSSALKARLSKSRGRPSLLTVGSSATSNQPPPPPPPPPASTPSNCTTVPAGPVPWTVLAAANSTASASTGTPPSEVSISSPSSSSLTNEQRAAIAARKNAALSKRKSLLTPLSKPEAGLSVVDRLTAQLRARQASVQKLRAQKFIQVDEAKTREAEVLTEKWTLTAQEVLAELLSKVQQTRAVTMDALLHDLQVDPKQVRWNEIAGDFE